MDWTYFRQFLLITNYSTELGPLRIRDGPNTTTTIIFQKSFASDVTSKRHLMADQIKNRCVFSVFHCVEGAFGAASGGTPKMKHGAPRDELKNGRGRGWAVACFCQSASNVVANGKHIAAK